MSMDKKRYVLLGLTLSLTSLCYGQRQVVGIVVDNNDEPIPGVKVSLSEGFIQLTDPMGQFQVTLPPDSDFVTVALSHELYQPKTVRVYQDEDTIPVRMMDVVTELDKITVTSHRYGRFSNYSPQTEPFATEEITAHANAFGDILAGMVNTPGVQSNANDGRLMIQGGGLDECLYYADGLILFNPYVESINVGNRFKLGQNLFEGTAIQSGGWSASYGNALSGIVQLNTASENQPKALTLYLSQSNAGVEGQLSTDQTILRGEVSYYNMRPYYDMIHSRADWRRDYQEITTDFSMLNRLARRGQLKTIVHYHHTTGEFVVPYSGYRWHYDKTEDDAFVNTAADVNLSDDWNLYTGANLAYRRQNSIGRISVGDSSALRQLNSHAKMELTYRGLNVNNRVGVENVLSHLDEDYWLNGDTTLRFTSHLMSLYDEVSVNAIPRVDLNLGVRLEYSTLLRSHNLMPRLYVGYHTGEHSTVSLSSGLYNQLPREELLRLNQDMSFRQSFNNTLSYQYRQENLMVQVDAYYKKYRHLETFTTDGPWIYNQIGNQGSGEVMGTNVFVKGSAWQVLNYWVNYSYLDAQLQTGYYPRAVMPDYLSHQRLTVSASTYVPWIKAFASASWFLDDGATFYRLGNVDDRHHSPRRHQLDLALYLMPYKNLSVYLSCQNVYGRKNVYGYRFSPTDPKVKEEVNTLDPRIYWVEFSITLINKKDRMKYIRKRLEDRMM